MEFETREDDYNYSVCVCEDIELTTGPPIPKMPSELEPLEDDSAYIVRLHDVHYSRTTTRHV